MRFMTLAVVLLTAAVSFGQSSRIVGGEDANGNPITGYQVGDQPIQWQRQETVPAPTSAPVFQDNRHPYQWSNHSWGGDPFTYPFPAGTYEVRNASIDKGKPPRTGAWSQPATVAVQSGSHLYCGGWNLPALQYESGVVWKIKCISVEPDQHPWMTVGKEVHLGYGNAHLDRANISPSVACEPELMKLSVHNPYFYPLSRLAFGGDYQTIAPPPVVVPTSIPNKRIRVAYCFVSETGETALSPPTAWSNPVQQAGWKDAQVVEFALNIRNYFPQGALGYHVYVQLENEQAPWQRLPASHSHGKPTQSDDWLFQLWDRQPQCWQYYADAPVHTPAAQPQSTLTGLHLALRDTGWFPWDVVPIDIVVEVDKIEVSCPVHDEWGSFGTGHPFKFARKVLSQNAREWVVKQKPSGQSRYWPVVHVSNSYSRWYYCSIHGDGASAALSFDDMAGGQCFGNKFYECAFYPGSSQCGGLSYGLMICERSTGSRGNHTHSEGRYYNCTFGGDVCMKVGGNQTANINFVDTLASANSGGLTKGRRNTALWLACPNEVRFRGLWGADSFSGPVVLASGYSAKLKADHIWKDQFSSTIFEAQTGCSLNARIMSGKFNLWSLYVPLTNTGFPPTLARFHHLPSTAYLTFEDIQSQFSYNGATADVTAPNVNMVGTHFENTALSDQTCLVEPTYGQWKTEFVAIFGAWSTPPAAPEIPGMKITVPAYTIQARTIQLPTIVVDGKASEAASITIPPMTIGARTITINSFTGKQAVPRRSWK